MLPREPEEQSNQVFCGDTRQRLPVTPLPNPHAQICAYRFNVQSSGNWVLIVILNMSQVIMQNGKQHVCTTS